MIIYLRLHIFDFNVIFQPYRAQTSECSSHANT